MPASQTTIGVFDSGVGGLTVLAALRSTLPGCNFVYLGDTARVPYGPKSARVVERYALEAAYFLQAEGADIIVIACNSASALAADHLKEVYGASRVFDVIGPGAQATVSGSQSGHIGVLGTRATISSGAYERAIRAMNPDAVVHSIACPLFVPLAEEGMADSESAEAIAKYYLEPLSAQTCDTVLLGCTHYPLLRATIERVLGPGVQVLDSALPVAREIADAISVSGDGQGACRLFTTDTPERFIEIGEPFLGKPIPETRLLDLEGWIAQAYQATGSYDFLEDIATC